MFEKIFKKIISLFMLMCCFAASVNITHAGCNENKTYVTTLSNGQKVKYVYLPHPDLDKMVDDENERQRKSDLILGLLTCGVHWIASAAISIGQYAAGGISKSDAERMRDLSREHDYCGIIRSYLWQKHPGGYYAGGGVVTKDTEGWDYCKDEPQKQF